MKMEASLRRVVTGHPEIDRQHAHLSGLTASLETICPRTEPDARCGDCGADRERACSNRLAELLGELIAFMVDHFRYEEALMRILPATDDCKQHVAAHKRSHNSVSRHLSELANEFEDTSPKDMALRLHTVVRHWLGDHAAEMDTALVKKIENEYLPEMLGVHAAN